jgi:hypothetical protein
VAFAVVSRDDTRTPTNNKLEIFLCDSLPSTPTTSISHQPTAKQRDYGKILRSRPHTVQQRLHSVSPKFSHSFTTPPAALLQTGINNSIHTICLHPSPVWEFLSSSPQRRHYCFHPRLWICSDHSIHQQQHHEQRHEQSHRQQQPSKQGCCCKRQ